eukprot:scaffold83063_cov37-Cyclotella_meneghiniana.AAC.1
MSDKYSILSQVDSIRIQIGQSSLAYGSAYSCASNNSAALILQAFLCIGRCVTCHLTVNAAMQALHDFRLTSDISLTASSTAFHCSICGLEVEDAIERLGC